MSTPDVTTEEPNPPASEPPKPSIQRTALRGASFVAVGFAAGQVIKIFSSVILTRLIHPEVYGLMDLAISCMVGIHLFSDLGITPCVVQSPRGEETIFLRTAWTLQVLRSLFIALMAVLIAWPIAHFYGKNILLFALPVIGLSSIVEALNAPGTFVLTRRVQRGLLVLMELLNSVFNLCLTVLIVYLMRPTAFVEVIHHVRPSLGLDENLLWAVVLGGLGARFLVMLISHVLLPGPRAGFTLDRSSAKEMIGFAKWVFFSTVLTFLGTQIDRFLVPGLSGFEAAGLYGRAMGLIGIGVGLISTFNSTVIYPIFGRLQNEGKELVDYYAKFHRLLGLAASIIVSGTFVVGQAVAHLLYPPEYADVGWMLQIFALGAWFLALQEFLGAGMLASGRRKAFVLPTGLKAVAMITVLVPCWWIAKSLGHPPIAGVAVGWVATNLTAYITALWLAHRSGIVLWKNDLFMTFRLVLVSLVGYGLGVVLVRLVGVDHPATRLGRLSQFLVMGLCAVALWFGVVLYQWRLGALDVLKRSRA